MRVNYEFFGSEPIENVITCMKYRMDKVVFLGYQEEMKEWEAKTKDFLKNACGVKEVEFLSAKRNDLNGILNVMMDSIRKDLEASHEIYLDLTGGDSLIVFAYGVIYKEYQLPVHCFDIMTDTLYEYNEKLEPMSAKAKKQDLQMDLDLFVRIYGGALNPKVGKDYRGFASPAFWQKVDEIFAYANRNWKNWNLMSEFLRSTLKCEEREPLLVRADVAEVRKVVNANGSPDKKVKKFPYEIHQVENLLQDLKQLGMIEGLTINSSKMQFWYTNEDVKNIIWHSGSILELYVYQRESKRCTDARVGIHLDWDGILHERVQEDVHNEVDVLLLDRNLPVFISCKSGKMDGKNLLNAMYELETVGKRFGGRYAKKRLVLTHQISAAYRQRAEEMDIEICVI